MAVVTVSVSNPATVVLPPGSTSLAFGIPPGTWTSGIWQVVGLATGLGAANQKLGGDTLNSGSFNGGYQHQAAVGATNLTAINSAAGGNFSATLQETISNMSSDTVSSVTLTLTGTPTIAAPYSGPTDMPCEA